MMISYYVLMEKLVINGVGVLTEAVSVYSVHVVLIHAIISGKLPTTRSSYVIQTVNTMEDTGNVQVVKGMKLIPLVRITRLSCFDVTTLYFTRYTTFNI